MSDERFDKTRSAVDAAGHIPAEKKTELLGLLSRLNPELAKASQTHPDHADKVARLVEASAHEATRADRKPESVNNLLGELKQSVEHFEASHPELVAFVTEYSAFLSALGI